MSAAVTVRLVRFAHRTRGSPRNPRSLRFARLVRDRQTPRGSAIAQLASAMVAAEEQPVVAVVYTLRAVGDNLLVNHAGLVEARPGPSRGGTACRDSRRGGRHALH